MEKKEAITVRNLHISYRGLKKTSIRSELFKSKRKKSKIEIFEAVKKESEN